MRELFHERWKMTQDAQKREERARLNQDVPYLSILLPDVWDIQQIGIKPR
jgi:hypothetical protein